MCIGVIASYLVGLVGSGCSDLALLAGRKLGEIAVVVTLPGGAQTLAASFGNARRQKALGGGVLHLVVEDLGLARLGLGDQGVVEHVEDILADLLELLLNLLSVLADGGDVLVRALGLLLLLDRRDDAPRGTSCADDVLVGNGKQVALVHGELAANLSCVNMCALPWSTGGASLRRRDGCSWHTLATS